MLRFLIIFLIVYLALILLMYFKQRSFMYHPLVFQRPDIRVAPWMGWVEVETQDYLSLRGWFSPPKEGKPTVALFHGNANSIAVRVPKTLPWVEQGYGVLLAEYRGYGGNPGKPSEQGLYKDARAYLNWLEQDKNIKAHDIILYGESLGSGVAVQMATEYEVKALILEVPFSSALDLAKSQFFFVPFMNYIMKDQYLSDHKIGNISAPVLIGVGNIDTVVPAKYGKKLFESANEPKKIVEYPMANHMTVYDSGFSREVLTFIKGFENTTQP